MKVPWKCLGAAAVLLALTGVAQADVMTFSDLDPGLPLDQQQEMPVDYSTGLPAGITATWDGWYWKNAAGPDDHTPDNDDHMQVFLGDSAGAISFSEPLFVQEMWMYKTSWGDTGDWTVNGLLDGVVQWSRTLTTDSVWISVQDGAGIAIDELSLPEQGQWNHVDDISFAPVPEPATLAMLGGLALGLLLWRWRRRA